MRNLAETDLSLIPEEIAIQEADVIQLMGLAPDVGIKTAYAAGAQAMDEFNSTARDDEFVITSNRVCQIAESISKSINLLRKLNSADFLPILDQIIDLVGDSLEHANSDLCNHFGIELDLL